MVGYRGYIYLDQTGGGEIEKSHFQISVKQLKISNDITRTHLRTLWLTVV